MTRRPLRRGAALRCSAAFLASFALAGASGAQAPSGGGAGVYVLRNARVVVSPERVLDRATVILRDGRIEAVGERVDAPGDARVLDLSGLTVYPGLVDAAASAPLAAGRSPGQGGEARLDPGRRASEGLELPEAARQAWRATGITTLGLAFAGGTDLRREPGPQVRIEQADHPLLPGQTSLLSLGSGPVEGLLVGAPPAVQVGFGTRTVHEYPVTLMGAIAFVHQAFLDAGYQRRLRASGGAAPGGGAPRVDSRVDVGPLEAASSGDQRVWFTVWQENNLKRAIALAEELGLDYALLGAQEGFRVADRLARAGRPVLVSLAYPSPAHATGRTHRLDVFGAGGSLADPERVDAESERAFRGNAAALAAAGVPVALTSYGLQDPGQFRRAVLQAVEDGLPAREALRALTVTPARILGVEDRFGTVEPGKTANLVIVDGDLFDPDATIRQVFVDGILFEASGPARASDAGRRSDHPSAGERR